MCQRIRSSLEPWIIVLWITQLQGKTAFPVVNKHQNNLHILHCFASSYVVIQNYSHYQIQASYFYCFFWFFIWVNIFEGTFCIALGMLKTTCLLPQSISLLSSSHTQMLLHLLFQMLLNIMFKIVMSTKIKQFAKYTFYFMLVLVCNTVSSLIFGQLHAFTVALIACFDFMFAWQLRADRKDHTG